jgi:hypothetical protein
MGHYWQLVIFSAEEASIYCYCTEATARNALEVMEARGAKGIVRRWEVY